ncbi:hypothetical protein J6590_034096 [Homalodisca vitripennis]|nr:hypothetical protein J6590_034096 [Homalodisca vitripennis]
MEWSEAMCFVADPLEELDLVMRDGFAAPPYTSRYRDYLSRWLAIMDPGDVCGETQTAASRYNAIIQCLNAVPVSSWCSFSIPPFRFLNTIANAGQDGRIASIWKDGVYIENGLNMEGRHDKE